ncbi:MAG: DUF4129 domain-containing protein [Candidatus Bathyarchaeota archaeon]
MRSRLLLALLVSLTLSGNGVAYCVDYPRHVDPTQLTLENPNPLQLFELYSQIYGYIAVSDYAGARQLLALAEDVAAPASTLKVLSQYNLLLVSVINDLNQTEGGLTEAFEHLRWLREALAEESLIVSGRQLKAANGTADNLDSVSGLLASVLRYSPGRLLECVDSLNRLIDELNARILEGFEEVELIKAMRLEETFLGIAVSDARPVVGSVTRVTGNLIGSAGMGVGGRVVRFYLEGSIVGEAETDLGGELGYSLRVPYRYVESLRLRAEYWPSAGDRGLYIPSVSNTVYLSPTYSTPLLLVEAPGVVYPGRGFQLRGALSHLSSPLGRATVSVRYLGSTHSVVSGNNGGFIVNLFTPEAAEEGLTQITVSSVAQGTVGPASAVHRVQVTRMPLEVAVEKPFLVFSGQDAVITGEVRSEGAPLQGCSVTIKMGEKVYDVFSDENGEFSIGCTTGVLTPSSRQTLEVVAAPREPWIQAKTLSSDFILINTVMAVALPFLGFAAVHRRRTAQPIAGTLMQQQAPVVEPVVYHALPGLYIRAVELVSRVTGVRLQPSYTIREYLRAAKPGLVGSVYSIFAGISELYERWYYGGQRSEPSLEAAESTVEKLRDQVEQGSA